MPGPYAHITLLHELMRHGRPGSIFSASSGVIALLGKNFPYCMLGAVSPDYPNLDPNGENGALWADAMHFGGMGRMMVSGIERVRGATGTVRDKQLAWLLGYCSHAVADMTIHPVVQAKVGAYAENQRAHRICEMNQDSHIYRRMNLGEIGDSERFSLTVARCGTPGDFDGLDSDIVALWGEMLRDVYPETVAVRPPDISAWHSGFVAGISDHRGNGRLFPLASLIVNRTGVAYPAYAGIDPQYVSGLCVPGESFHTVHYDNLFYHAMCNVAFAWRVVEGAVCGDDRSGLALFGEWNLDTGCDDCDRLVYW